MWQRPCGIPLKWQLTGAFALIILPSLVLVFFILERSGLEKRIRQLDESQAGLENHLQTIDASRRLFLGYGVSLLDRLFAGGSFATRLHHFEGMSGNDSIENGMKLIQELQTRATFLGFPMDELLLVGPRKFTEDQHREILSRFFSFSIRSVLEILNPHFSAGDEKNSAAGDLIMGGAFEEIHDLVRLLMTPEDCAKIVLAPRSFDDVNTSSGLDSYYLRSIQYQGFPRYGLHLKIDLLSIDLYQCRYWQRDADLRRTSRDDTVPHGGAPFVSAPSVTDTYPRFDLAYANTPALTLFYPFCRINFTKTYSPKMYEVFFPSRPGMTRLRMLANTAGIPVKALQGEGVDEKLVVIMKGQVGTNLLYSGYLSVGRLLEVTRKLLEQQRFSLFLLFIISIFLAQYVSRRFLEPVLRLSREAGIVMSGIFTGRLPEDRGGEFGKLARAFNLMIAGVAEGKLLSKFVSESVRFAAADQEKGDAARKGEIIDVTVMFAGIADFKSLTAQMPPEKLVIHLNHFLEAMSQVIRKHGGDIDKFIGEKILAVFHPSRLGGKEAAMNAALEAGSAMRKRMAELQDEVPRPLGVGIVSGSVLAGIMGTPEVRLEYTVIGDTVNLSSRLGDLALRLGPDGTVLPDYHGSIGGVVVEAATCEALQNTGTGSLYRMMKKLAVPPIKGKKRSVEASYLAS